MNFFQLFSRQKKIKNFLGTLTKNKLTVADPVTYGGLKSSTVIFQASLASRPETEDAIDIAIVEHLTEKQIQKRNNHEVLYSRPFDPVSKKAFAKVRDSNGRIFHAAKGKFLLFYIFI